MKNFKRKFLKTNKGITLVTLIVTIIVLLILAGVAIATLMGDNGVINRTSGAKDSTNIAGAKERTELYAQEFGIDFRTQNLATGSAATNLADYIAEQLNGKDALGYSVSTTGKNVTLSKDGQDVATGSVNDGGKIVWGSVQPITPVDPEEPEPEVYTGNLTETELGILSTNKMAELTTDEIDADTNLTSDQKTALKDTTKVKAVLTGNVPIPVEYEYIGGTSTAIQTSDDVDSGTNGWGVVIKDSNDNEWVWVPVNSNESVSPDEMWDPVEGENVGLNTNKKTYTNVLAKINGVKLASSNGLNGLKIAESSSSSEEEEVVEILTNVTTNIYGGLYVGRYELSGTNNGGDREITNPKVQSKQAPMDRVNWYRLYQACRTFGDNTITTSTMIWGTQWDLVCK